MIENLERGMTLWIFVKYFDFRGPKSWKIDTCNSWATTNHDSRPNLALDQKVEENRPPFKKIGICCFNFLIWGRFQPKMVNLCHVTISCIIFSWFGPLKIKIFGKNYMVITLLRFLTILAFKILKKLNIGLKIGILKMFSKNSDSPTHSASLEIWWHLCHKMTNSKK